MTDRFIHIHVYKNREFVDFGLMSELPDVTIVDTAMKNQAFFCIIIIVCPGFILMLCNLEARQTLSNCIETH